MVFIGNTSHNVPYMLKHGNLFMDLPEAYRNSDGQAILDRMHWFLPGWEMENLRSEMFSDGYGFVVDYLAEILRYLRTHDFSDRYSNSFSLSSDISTRDRDGINKTFSGLMKIIYPHGEATREETEEILKFTIEGRKRVKDQLMRIDPTYSQVEFSYKHSVGKQISVSTLEEGQYPQYYKSTDKDPDQSSESINKTPMGTGTGSTPAPFSQPEIEPKEQHILIQENQKGSLTMSFSVPT